MRALHVAQDNTPDRELRLSGRPATVQTAPALLRPWLAYNEPVDETMAELLAKTAALGVWLFGPRGDVIAGAVKDSSIEAPMAVSITGVTYFGERHIYAEPLGSKILVFMFDDRPSLGLIRLGVRKAANVGRNSRVSSVSVQDAVPGADGVRHRVESACGVCPPTRSVPHARRG